MTVHNHKNDPLTPQYMDAVHTDNVVMVQCLQRASDVAVDPHCRYNVNFSCGSHLSSAEVIDTHEQVCEMACDPTGVCLEWETTPICNMIESSNSAVHSHGSMYAKVGDEASALTTEYYSDSSLRQTARCQIGVESKPTERVFDGSADSQQTELSTIECMKTAVTMQALNASGWKHLAQEAVVTVYKKGVATAADGVQSMLYTLANAQESGVDPPVPLGYKAPGFTGTGGSHGREDSSEETLLPSLGGETTELAMCMGVAHVESLYKPEVGMANVVGVVGSVVVTWHAQSAGPDITEQCEYDSMANVSVCASVALYAYASGIDCLEDYNGTTIPMADGAYLYDTSETTVLDGANTCVGYYRVQLSSVYSGSNVMVCVSHVPHNIDEDADWPTESSLISRECTGHGKQKSSQ